jgi:hypothetical protein
MRHVSASLLLLTLLAATPAFGQVQSRPTDAPIVTAANESWYVAREPIQFAGDIYYPAGAAVFFNGNQMARAGHYNGVPLYTDTTIEPYSIVYLPVSRGLMQPYERFRDGALAGTTGSRVPSFPVSVAATRTTPPEAAIPPTGLPVPIGAVSAYTPEDTGGMSGAYSAPTAVGMSRIVVAPIRSTPERTAIVSAIRPQTNDGVWVSYLGEKWVSAGMAVPLTPAGFSRVGNYEGFPVFTREGTADRVIYLPTREGLFAPYRLKQAH